MSGKNTIIINGQAYDAVSGRAVSLDTTLHAAGKKVPAGNGAKPLLQTAKGVISDFGTGRAKRPAPSQRSNQPTMKQAAAVRSVAGAHNVHKTPDRSHTLLRKATKRPSTLVAPLAAAPTETSDKRSPMIRRFAAHPAGVKPVLAHADAPKRTAPAVAAHSTHNPHPASAQPQPHPVQVSPADHSRALKEHLIKERLDEAPTAHHQAAHEPRGLKKLLHKPRTMHVATTSLALMVLGGYLTFINMPNLSVRVAAARSGVQASYPEYQPDGYRFSGPVAYSPGEVTLRFKSNTNPQSYAIKQRGSNWDSQAVLDNIVTKDSASYLTYSEQGLTVYTYKNKAAWVNGGILYTIDGDAPLGSEQVLRIAASL